MNSSAPKPSATKLPLEPIFQLQPEENRPVTSSANQATASPYRTHLSIASTAGQIPAPARQPPRSAFNCCPAIHEFSRPKALHDKMPTEPIFELQPEENTPVTNFRDEATASPAGPPPITPLRQTPPPFHCAKSAILRPDILLQYPTIALIFQAFRPGMATAYRIPFGEFTPGICANSPRRRTKKEGHPMTLAATEKQTDYLRALPGDDARQILWRFADRFDLQMLVQSVRAVARGPVARLVAAGARNTHEWTADKNALLQAFDESGITGVFMEPSQGGFIEGPKNLALALVAFEPAWVDAGAATGSLAGCLALSPIHERGTPEQRDYYMSRCAPGQPGEDRKPWRGAFCLTEPIPYVGVETGLLGGKVRIAEWKGGEEPILQVEKRGRFITNMGFAAPGIVPGLATCDKVGTLSDV